MKLKTDVISKKLANTKWFKLTYLLRHKQTKYSMTVLFFVNYLQNSQPSPMSSVVD